MQAILGMGNYYRIFIKDYSKKIQPLIQLTKKDKSFEWTAECQKSFDQLKEALTGPDILAYPTDDGEFILDTDTSLDMVGAILSQVQDGVECVIAYGSRTLSKPEQIYCVTDRELLAVRFFMKYYKHYLLERQFLARTDNQALKWLSSLKEPKDRIARWLETLSAYQFSIEYWPGNKHGNANAMFWRCPNPEECKCLLLEEEILKCSPCQKCHQKAETMDSTIMDSQGSLRSMQVQGDEPVCMVQTHSQTKGQQAYDPKMVTTVMAAKGRNRQKYGRMGF